jgi:hypothetical protein
MHKSANYEFRQGHGRAAITVTILWVLAFLSILPLELRAQQDTVVASNAVVRIICKLNGGNEMVSTGFAWRDKLHVVATLHGVAGCKNLRVKGVKNKEAEASIEAANLEADLAYLVLSRDVGLKPASLYPGPVNPRGSFYSWGHPDGAILLRGAETKMAITTDNTATSTLELAHEGTGKLDKLFADKAQNYPSKDAKILMVTSTIVSGQSGSPILDLDGQVVGIIDGTVGGGFVGMNWAISAFDYLPDLHDSGDNWPNVPSKWAGLKSKVEVKNPPPPTEFPISGTEATGELGKLLLVRRISLADMEKEIDRQKNDFWRDVHLGNIQFIREVIDDSQKFAQAGFDIYEDQTTGATVGVPSGLKLRWNAALGMLEATTNSGQVSLYISVKQYDSFNRARSVGKQVFTDNFQGFAQWDRPLHEADYGNEYESREWAEPSKTDFTGPDSRTGVESSLALTIGASRNAFLGYAAYGPDDIAALPDQGTITWLMMQFAVDYLIAFSGR